MSEGTDPPFGGSITIKKLPVPTSGLLHTSTVSGPMCRFCIIGYGGPMCAHTFAPPLSKSSATAPQIRHANPLVREVNPTLIPVNSTRHHSGPHIHWLRNQPA